MIEYKYRWRRIVTQVRHISALPRHVTTLSTPMSTHLSRESQGSGCGMPHQRAHFCRGIFLWKEREKILTLFRRCMKLRTSYTYTKCQKLGRTDKIYLWSVGKNSNCCFVMKEGTLSKSFIFRKNITENSWWELYDSVMRFEIAKCT